MWLFEVHIVLNIELVLDSKPNAQRNGDTDILDMFYRSIFIFIVLYHLSKQLLIQIKYSQII